ncbi:iron-sulfur cluster assembly accessory protein [Gloeothece citriformis PCC 7424]|uniref:Iron-sulfur cluster assembly accessory protein n=1 Tax=Gloeothece citriformis (strain PCC 7424) TaxID=65393 RepID=B7KG65_GLOC7|nr:iron-sulfur cluster assembly accessory protein [Gloeothece citriformis]ACK70536.1 iron-sulfur cluster assembly accessory protein [Gloeothece citriformis PCC 7424]
MAVLFTDKAAFRLRTFLREKSANSETLTKKGVRVGVIDGGCNGYEYTLEIIGQPNPDDLIFEQDKMFVYIDPKSAPLLDGIIIDFAESLTQAGFIFKNPNATNTCGCGKSFSVGECTPTGAPCS